MMKLLETLPYMSTVPYKYVEVTEASRSQNVTNPPLTVMTISKLYIVYNKMVVRFSISPRPANHARSASDGIYRSWYCLCSGHFRIDNLWSDIMYISYWMQGNLCGFMSALLWFCLSSSLWKLRPIKMADLNTWTRWSEIGTSIVFTWTMTFLDRNLWYINLMMSIDVPDSCKARV